jgi:hypothetical protein
VAAAVLYTSTVVQDMTIRVLGRLLDPGVLLDRG